MMWQTICNMLIGKRALYKENAWCADIGLETHTDTRMQTSTKSGNNTRSVATVPIVNKITWRDKRSRCAHLSKFTILFIRKHTRCCLCGHIHEHIYTALIGIVRNNVSRHGRSFYRSGQHPCARVRRSAVRSCVPREPSCDDQRNVVEFTQVLMRLVFERIHYGCIRRSSSVSP